MERKNCWEIMACGRQPGGDNAEELGICAAALPHEHFEGVNRGMHCGRFCWAVAGTLCGGKVQGTYSKKFMDCMHCEFLKHVTIDEGRNFILISRDAMSESYKEA
jgi:hypothetical protein